MSNGWVELLAAVLIALPGILGLLVQLRNYRETADKTRKEAIKIGEEAEREKATAEKLKNEAGKVNMEAADNLVDTALSLTTPLKEENRRLLNRNKYLERGCKILIKQLKAAAIDPDFDPNNGNGENGSS